MCEGGQFVLRSQRPGITIEKGILVREVHVHTHREVHTSVREVHTHSEERGTLDNP